MRNTSHSSRSFCTGLGFWCGRDLEIQLLGILQDVTCSASRVLHRHFSEPSHLCQEGLRLQRLPESRGVLLQYPCTESQTLRIRLMRTADGLEARSLKVAKGALALLRDSATCHFRDSGGPSFKMRHCSLDCKLWSCTAQGQSSWRPAQQAEL